MSELQLFSAMGKTVSGLINTISNRIDRLSIVNLAGLAILAIFCSFSVISDSLLGLLYVFLDFFAKFNEKNILLNNPTTPFWHYAIFLFLGFFLCLYIVRAHNKRILW